MIDTVAPNIPATNRDGTPKPKEDVIAALRLRIEQVGVPAGVKHRLLLILDDARGDIDEFRTAVEMWFDDSMARVSGWYKRKTQVVLVVIAVVMTPVLNANTLTIGNRLWHSPEVRAAVVQQAQAAADQTPGKTAKEKLDSAAANVDAVGKLGVPLGWSGDAKPSFKSVGGWTAALGGWLLTIAAISIGTPFWFDALSRLSRLRGTGKPEAPLSASGRGQLDERVRSRRQ